MLQIGFPALDLSKLFDRSALHVSGAFILDKGLFVFDRSKFRLKSKKYKFSCNIQL